MKKGIQMEYYKSQLNTQKAVMRKLRNTKHVRCTENKLEMTTESIVLQKTNTKKSRRKFFFVINHIKVNGLNSLTKRQRWAN